jgi:hypothetical protein
VETLPQVEFRLKSPSNDLAVDPATGVITTKRELSYNYAQIISVDVVVTENVPSEALNGDKYTDTCTFRVEIVDRNQAPQISDATFEVNENTAKGVEVGEITARDTDTSRFTFQITSVEPSAWSDAFELENAQAGKISVADPSLLDYELLAPHNFRIILNIQVDDMHPT